MAPSTTTALVTGAASGIGEAISRLLASQGSHVICVDSNAPALDAVVSSITSDGGSAVTAVIDMSDATAVASFVAQTTDGSLDMVALCAGIFAPTPADAFDRTVWNRVIDVNVTGAVHLLTGLLPRLEASAAPRVVMISSIQADHGESGSVAYAASKAALVAATKVLATELAPRGVLVNAIAPGFVDTAMAVLADGTNELQTDSFRQIYIDAGKLPLGRAATAHEIALSAAFLLAPTNTYITGHVLVVDGGLTATF